MLSRLSLRARLVLGVIVLTAVGLVAADVVTYTSLRSFLFHRTDSTIDAAHQGVEQAVFGGGSGPAPFQTLTATVPGDCIQVRRLNGSIVGMTCIPAFRGASSPEPPKLPAHIAIPKSRTGGDRVSRFNVPAQAGGRYRVRASIEPQAANYVLIIAAPLSSVDSTLHRLLVIE